MRNEEKLASWGLDKKVRYYYLKINVDEHGRATAGIATVCLIPVTLGDTGYRPTGGIISTEYARGISFYNPKDKKQFVKKVGRNIALGRAIKAISSGQSSEPIPVDTPARVLLGLWGNLSEWDAKLTSMETRIMKIFLEHEEGKGQV